MKHKIEVDGEIIYLKKNSLGWGVIHPIKNEDGSWNWKNLIAGGNWTKLVLIMIFVFIMILAIIEVSNITQIANKCLNQTPIIIIP